MDNTDCYIELKDKDIIFKGNTPEEKELNKWLYHITLELNRYQDMTEKVLDYILIHSEVKEVQEIYQIIKDWQC